MNIREPSRSDTYAKAQSADLDRSVSKKHKDGIKGGRNEREGESGDDQ